MKFQNRSLPATPTALDDGGNEYCVISNGKQVDDQTVQSFYQVNDQVCMEEGDNPHKDESEAPAHTGYDDTVIYVVGEIECIDPDNKLDTMANV